MSITIKQLAALAEEFEFDLAEARSFLGHTEPKKRGRPSKGSDSDSDDGKPTTKCVGSTCKAQTKTATKTASKAKIDTPREKRSPTGYHLYMASVSTKVGDSLKKATKDGKLSRGAVASEVGRLWQLLDEKKRDSWNTKAKAA